MMTLILAYFMAVLSQSLGTDPPVVDTPLGKIEGVASEMESVPVKMFLGIPYAKPPVGDQRFLKPEPVEAWSDTLEATKQPPGCIQYTEAPFSWYDNMTGKSEDCLYLNIYTPSFATKGSKLAVLFWIYGGGLTHGSNRLDMYDGRVMAEREGVVLVTINYRMGLFGFLTSNTSDAPGNMGLYDMVMALQWVNDNIEYFGGDKDRITIFGESAGSIATSILCISPLTKGMLSGCILESGSIAYFKENTLGYNLDLTEKLAEAVDCAAEDFTIYDHPTEVVQCLRYRNASYLAENLWKFNPLSTVSLFPQYGDSLLPNNAIEDLKKGNFNNVPILAGSNLDEGSIFISTLNPEEFGSLGQKDPKVNKTYATTLLQGVFANFPNPQEYIDYYLNVPDEDYDKIRKQVYDAFGDSIVLCHTVYFAESYASRGNDVYFYFFTHRPSTTIWAEWMGAAHYEEVQFVFGRPVRVPTDYNEDEVWLSSKMMKIWANFAKDGNPGISPDWPKYSKENHTYMLIDVKKFW